MKREGTLTSSVHRKIAVGSTVSKHGSVAPPRRSVAQRPWALHGRSPIPAHQHNKHGTRAYIYEALSAWRPALTTHVNSPMAAPHRRRERTEAARRISRAHPSPFLFL